MQGDMHKRKIDMAHGIVMDQPAQGAAAFGQRITGVGKVVSGFRIYVWRTGGCKLVNIQRTAEIDLNFSHLLRNLRIFTALWTNPK